MRQYLDLVKLVMDNGTRKPSRTGVDTISYFGAFYKVDLNEGFPLLTTKKMHWNSLLHEVLWYLSGENHIRNLRKHTKIWDAWADEKGDLGPVYGFQWRNWNGDEIDQITELIDTIKTNQDSRRMIVSAWNPSVLPDTSVSFSENVANNKAALPPCHAFFQFYVSNGKLSCQLYQRSADIFLGVPFNIASYALLTMMIAQVTNLEYGDFIHTFGDAHIYNNHMDQINLQLSRDPRELPRMEINPNVKNIFKFSFSDFNLVNYSPHPHIKGIVSI